MRKFVVAVLAVPIGLTSLLIKPASAAEASLLQVSQSSVTVAQRYDDRQDNGRRDNDRQDNDRRDNDRRERERRDNDRRERERRDNDRRDNDRRYESRKGDLQQAVHRDELRRYQQWGDRYYHRDSTRGVWIPGHYESGFLGIGRRWVEGHWERR